MSKLRILMRDGDAYYKYANVDWLDGGNGLLIYDYASGEKLSRHEDGHIYSRIAGAGEHSAPSTTVPFSDISHETVRQVPIPPEVAPQLQPYQGDESNCFVFSSTCLSSNATFAAEIVDDENLSPVLEMWTQHPDYVSAQTCRSNEAGKSVVLTVLNSRSI